jgi:hypothetical protein
MVRESPARKENHTGGSMAENEIIEAAGLPTFPVPELQAECPGRNDAEANDC